VTVDALCRSLFVDDHFLPLQRLRLCVASVTAHIRMPALQGEMCPSVVIEGGGRPSLDVVTSGARGDSIFTSELFAVDILVARLALCRRPLELHLFGV
jgi:hypothetical protein